MDVASPFLRQLPDEVVLFAIRNLSGYQLLRLKVVDRRAHDLVVALFKHGAYWNWLGFHNVPTQIEVDRAFSVIKDRYEIAFLMIKRDRIRGQRFSILEMPASTSPLRWKILSRLKLVRHDIESKPYAVLKRASGLGDVDLCRKALDSIREISPQGVLIDSMEFNFSMLKAIRRGHLHVVEMFLETGWYPDLNYFLIAIQEGQIAIAERLVSLKPDLRRDISDLQWAAFLGRTENFNELAGRPGALEASEDFPGPLFFAASSGQAEAIVALHHLGANILETDDTGKTALQVAAKRGHTEAIRVLKDLGCPIEATDETGNTALHVAAKRGHTEAIRVLMDLRCNMEATDENGLTALHSAAKHGQTDAIEMLVKLGCSVEATDNLGRTALHWAAENRHTDTIKKLLDRGCPLSATDNKGLTARDLAVGYFYLDIMAVLSEYEERIEPKVKRRKVDGSP